MKVLHRPSSSRLHRDDGWKQSWYAFVPNQTHFGELCGFADDIVQGGVGFPMHPHCDMEISTIVTRGAQLHEDSTGGKRRVEPGVVQTMSAGTGIAHSEVNASDALPFHSYQIWVHPRRTGAEPRSGNYAFTEASNRNALVLALSPDEREGSALIGQDAFFSLCALDAGRALRYRMHQENAGVYIHCAEGTAVVAGQALNAGDAIGLYDIGLYDIAGVELSASSACELICVEVPMHRGVRG